MRSTHNSRIISVLDIFAIFLLCAGAAISVPHLIISQSQSSIESAGWTSFIGDYQDSRYNPESGINSSNVGDLHPAWFYSTGASVASLPTAYNASVTSTPVVANGSVFFSDWLGNTYSVNLMTGSLNWEDHLNNGSISSTPAIVDGIDYVAELEPPILFALNETTGKTIWSSLVSTSPYIGLWSSPIIYRDILYIGLSLLGADSDNTTVGAMDALNATTGSVLWSFSTALSPNGGGVWGSVAVDTNSDTIFFGTANPNNEVPSASSLYSDSIICLNATTGAFIWYNQVFQNDILDRDFGSTPNLFSINVSGKNVDVVGLGSKGGYYYIFDRANGTLISKVYGGQIIGLAGFLGQGANLELFIPGRTVQASGIPPVNSSCPGCGILTAYFPTNESVAWSFVTGDIVGSVALADGVVFVGDQNGQIYGLSTSTGKVLFDTTLSVGIWGGVTVADGYLIIGGSASAPGIPNGQDLGVYAFSLNPTEPTTTFQTTFTGSYSSSTFTSHSISYSTTENGSSANFAKIPVYWALIATVVALVLGVTIGYLTRFRTKNEA